MDDPTDNFASRGRPAPEQGAYVIVGASLAGARAAGALRRGGFEGRIVLIGAETHLPYERPELSKGYLQGKTSLADLLVESGDYLSENQVEFVAATEVTAIDRDAGEVVCGDATRIPFERLLLATGSEPRMLDIPGVDLPGVLTLRTLEDADRLRARLTGREIRLVVVGGGWIGCEVAASARELGAEVAMVLPEQYPLRNVLGDEVGRAFSALHTAHGVRLYPGESVAAILGQSRAEGVRTQSGTTIEGDLVVIAVGARPRDDLARAAGLEVDNGVVVDEYLRTSDERIFAAGDIANAWHPVLGQRVRVEHWATARNQGPAAAANMLGRGEPYTDLPFFFSDQWDLGIEYRGLATQDDDVVLRGDPGSGEYLAFWLREGRVVAAMNANIWDAGDDLEALITSGATPDPEALADPNIELSSLLPE